MRYKKSLGKFRNLITEKLNNIFENITKGEKTLIPVLSLYIYNRF